MNFLRCFLIFPTWLMMQSMIGFVSKKHPWYKRKFTMLDWYYGSTELNILYSVSVWIFVLILIIFIILNIK